MMHEEILHAIRNLAIAKVSEPGDRVRLHAVKLVYGAGGAFARGTTYHDAWFDVVHRDFVEVGARHEESLVQLAGTTLHELGHVLAGRRGGHGPAWKRACATLGLRRAEAAGQVYRIEDLEPTIWHAIEALEPPSDGMPAFGARGDRPAIHPPGPCRAGVGRLGGHSRGRGSGSRLRLFLCACPIRVRVAADRFDATCHHCGCSFKRDDSVAR